MRRTWGVLFVFLSTFGLADGAGAQQGAGSAGRQACEFSLEQNFPNPFTSETRIPFTLCESLFAEGRPVVVSIRIFNILQQLVAVPTAIGHAAGEGVPLFQLEYSQPGEYQALWDGRDQEGRPVVSGTFWVQLTVNGDYRSKRIRLQRP